MTPARRLTAVVPGPVKRLARDVVSRARFARWRTEPICVRGGSTRGLTIHRRYLEQFLATHAGDIRGRCLEFEADVYTTRFGTPTTLDVLHVDDANPAATIVADLTQPNSIASDQFDCIVCTHVLHVVRDPGAVVRELSRIMAPGGVLLVGSPFVCPIKSGEAQQFVDEDMTPERWRFTGRGLFELLEPAFTDVSIHTYGNSLAAAAVLRGLTAHELGDGRLDVHDERFTVEVCARAQK